MQHFTIRAVILVLFAAVSGQRLMASQNCDNQTFKGVYGLFNQGVRLADLPPGLSGPVARVGRAIADGKGNLSAQFTGSINGLTGTGELTGTYTVNPDCTISSSVLVPLPGIPAPVPYALVGALADHGREVMFLPDVPPAVSITIQFLRQDRTNCSNRDLSSGFLLSMSGTIVSQPPNIPGVFLRVGRAEFDGQGRFTAETRASYAGMTILESFSGTYSVDSSCLFTLQYTLGQTYTWTGMLTDNSSKAYLLVSDPPGAVVGGTLRQQ